MENDILPDEKVLVALTAMGLEKEPRKLSEKTIHRIFYKYLSEYKDEYSDLLKEFAFSTSGTYPYSSLLERVLMRAKASRVLKTSNPDYEAMQLAKGTDEFLQKKTIPILKKNNDYDKLVQIGKALRLESKPI